MQHIMKLTNRPFSDIASGRKVIESRLFDEKRQQISIGDTIVFIEKGSSENTLHTVVKDLFRYPTFKDLFAKHDPLLFGEARRDILLTQIKTFYSAEDEQKYGVVGILIELGEENDLPKV